MANVALGVVVSSDSGCGRGTNLCRQVLDQSLDPGLVQQGAPLVHHETVFSSISSY